MSQRVSGPTVQTPDLLLMPVGPAQRVEIHQTLIFKAAPPRVYTRLAKLGRWEMCGCGSKLHRKSHLYTGGTFKQRTEKGG